MTVGRPNCSARCFGGHHDRHGLRRRHRLLRPSAPPADYVLGQDEASSDVYGMNKAAYQAGHVDCQFPLGDVGAIIGAEVKRMLALQK